MSKVRKPRAPAVSIKALKDVQSDTIDPEIQRLAYRFEVLEQLRQAGEINTQFLAFEVFRGIADGAMHERSDTDLRGSWPKEWERETVTLTLPKEFAIALRDGWGDYKKAPAGKKLGEVFEVEGGKPGSHAMKARLARIDRDRTLAAQVETRYLKIEQEEQTGRLNDVIQSVADENKLGFKTVKNAHKAHRDGIRAALVDLGILRGPKNLDG